MNRIVVRGCLAAMVLIAGVAAAQDADERTVSDNVRDEDALIAILESDAGWEAKHTACRSLRRVGTEKSVPPLAALLDDPELSHMARFALEAMPFPEAGQALRDALTRTQAAQRVGVIISIGARRDAAAVPQLATMTRDGNLDIARAASAALGRIATDRAVVALLDAYTSAPARYQPALAEALLAAGQALVERKRPGDAVPVYETLLDEGQPEYVRLGAFRGIVNAQPDQAPERIIAALEGDDTLMRDMAGQLVAETSGEKATNAYANALASLDGDAKIVLLRGLGDRGDAAAQDAVRNAVASGDTATRLAALRALAKVGAGEDVTMLADLLAADDDAISGAARDTLANMEHEDTDAAIIAALPAADAATRATLLTLLAGRGAGQAVAVASEHLDSDAPQVRVAAIEILGRIGSADEAQLLVAALLDAEDAAVATAASQALGVLSEREADAVVKPLLRARADATGETEVAVLRALGRAATPAALAAVVEALGDDALKGEAARILTNWPTADAAPHLLELARTGDAGTKGDSLRAYVRLAGQEESVDTKVKMLTSATKLAETPQEKWIVLSAWGQTPSTKSLDALLPHLNDEAVQNEAAAAIIGVAVDLGKNEGLKKNAAAALQTVIDTAKDDAIRERAQTALDAL